MAGQARVWPAKQGDTSLDDTFGADGEQILKELHASVKPEDPMADSVDNSRGTLLLEILSLEIKMHTEMKNNKKLREIYDQTLQVKSAIPHPRIMGVIRECGGKMHMSERMSIGSSCRPV